MPDQPDKRSDEMKGVKPPSQAIPAAPLPPAAIKPQGALPKRETLRITLPKSARSTKKSTRMVPNKPDASGATTMPIMGAEGQQAGGAWTTQVTRPMPAKIRQELRQEMSVMAEGDQTEPLPDVLKGANKPETAKVTNPGVTQEAAPRPMKMSVPTMQAKTPSEPLPKPVETQAKAPAAPAAPSLPKPPTPPKPPAPMAAPQAPAAPAPSQAALPKPPSPPKPPVAAPKPPAAIAAEPPPAPPKLAKDLVGKMTDKISTPKEDPKSATTPTPMPTQALKKPAGGEVKAVTGLKKPPVQPIDGPALKLRPKTTVLTPMPSGALNDPAERDPAAGAPVLKVENAEAAEMKVQESPRPSHPPTISKEQSELLLRKKTAPVKLITGHEESTPAPTAPKPKLEPPPHNAAKVYDPADPKGKQAEHMPQPPKISTQQLAPAQVKKMALPKAPATKEPEAKDEPEKKPTPKVKAMKPVIQLKEPKPGPESETGRISSKISGLIGDAEEKKMASSQPKNQADSGLHRPEVHKIALPDSSRIDPDAGKATSKRPSGPVPKPQIFYAKPQEDSTPTAQLTRPIEEEVKAQKKDPMDAPKPPPPPAVAKPASPPAPAAEPEKVTRVLQGKEISQQINQMAPGKKEDPTTPQVTGPMPPSLKANPPVPPAAQPTAGIKPPAPPSKPTPPPTKPKPEGVSKAKSEPPPPPPAAVVKPKDKIEVPAASAGPTIPISPAPAASAAPKPPAPAAASGAPKPPPAPPKPAAPAPPKPAEAKAGSAAAPTVGLEAKPPVPVSKPAVPTAKPSDKPAIKPPAPVAPTAGGPKPPAAKPPAPGGAPKPPAPSAGGPKPPAPKPAPPGGAPKPPAPSAGGPKPPAPKPAPAAAGAPKPAAPGAAPKPGAPKPASSPAAIAKPKQASGTAAIKPGSSPRKETVQIKAGIMPKKPGASASKPGSPTPKPVTPAPSAPKPASKPLAGGAAPALAGGAGAATATKPKADEKADSKPAPMPMMAAVPEEDNKLATYLAGAAAAISWLTATYLALAWLDMAPF